MKRLFAQASKPFAAITLPGLPKLNQTPGSAAPGHISSHNVGLQPKYLVPPIPHPCPYDHLALLVTKDGLLIRQHLAGHDPKTEKPNSYVRVVWGRTVKVEEIVDAAGASEVDWSDSVIVYGIVGILELFSGADDFDSTVLSKVIDGSHTVYGVKGVTAIPLVEEKARITLNTLAARNAQLTRPSILPSSTLDTVAHSQDPENEDSETPTPLVSEQPHSPPRVQFSAEDQVKFMTPTSPSFKKDIYTHSDAPSSAQSSSSDLSTPSSSEQTIASSLVAKTLADRLSFWSRLSKRTSLPPSTSQTWQEVPAVPVSTTALSDRESLDKVIEEGKEEPAVVLDSILAATAPPPASAAEQHSELEDKIVRECVREFTRGGMYFAYNFDITRSLQHKQDQITKAQKKHDLLADLNALPSPSESGPSLAQDAEVEGTKISPMSEPNPTLPLWRRVDKRFWWNEWLSKPFVDAGLHSYVLPIMQGYYQVAHFVIPPDPVTHDEDVLVDYVIISRRSRYRAGLRYQRRGIDDDANVANFVETETIMRVESGYGLKPPPLLASDRTHAQNIDVLKKHFERTVPLYGPHVRFLFPRNIEQFSPLIQTIMNLAEQSGKEGPITQGYKEYMQELDSKDAR
ncbi:hypothetical protein DXG03_005730 [Asterophora parasitica]|uniref:SAC domain-containing protein n=1 Tax=Asterophora parasitica TaxID=117018 RepID=A0A9P7GE95_9AGAR|nr:hypothetical protein DXG03_005730 [Asterophora parasitica]